MANSIDDITIDRHLSDYERNLLEYRPVITYQKRDADNINNVVIPSEYNVSSDIQDVINRLPSNTTTMAAIFNETLQGVISAAESILIQTPAMPTPLNLSTITSAADALGIDISNGITYEIYKDLMNDPYNDEYDKQIIIEAWREYHSDVNGSLAGEYYTDLIEMNQDFTSLIDFWDNATIKYLDSGISLDPMNLSSAISKIEAAEQVMINNLILYKHELDGMKTELRSIMLTSKDPNDPSNVKYNKISSRYKTMESAYGILQKKGNVMCEVADIVNKKINMNGVALQRIDMFLKQTPQDTYEGNLVDTLEALLTGCLGPDFLESLKRLRVMMRYQIDNEAKAIVQDKSKNDAVFSPRIKRIVQDICRKDIAIKVGVCHQLLTELDNVPDNLARSMEPIAQKLLGSLRNAENTYGNNIVQLYGAHLKNAEALTRRVMATQDKNTTRDFYKILTIMINHMENGGSSPTTGSLRQWIISLLNGANLNSVYDYDKGDYIQLDLQ